MIKTFACCALLTAIFLVCGETYSSGQPVQQEILSRKVYQQAKCEKYLRDTLGYTVGAEKFLNDGLIVSKSAPNTLDLQAAILSFENEMAEVHYFEVIDAHGAFLFKIDHIIGGLAGVDTKPNTQSLFKKLEELTLQNVNFWIRDTHVHPPLSKRSLFSPEDIESMFLLHALLEFSGFKQAGIEYSILYVSSKRLKLNKKTITIAPGQLSYVNGDYSLGDLDDFLKKHRPEDLRNLADIALYGIYE